jgi:hypothetical protein
VQFWEGESAVQYPSDNTTRVVTTVEAAGHGDGFASECSQNLTVTRAPGGSTLTVNGTGNLDIDPYTRSYTDQAGSTTCVGEAHFTTSVHDVVIEDGQDGCPRSGVVTHTGAIDVACTGGRNWTHVGQWSVTASYAEDGTVTHRFTRGRRVWNATGTCQ